VDGAVCWSGCTVDVTGTGVPSSPASCVPEHAQHAAACEAFSCFVAHDLRAPVHRIRGFAQALIEAGEQDHRGRVTRLARRIAANAAGMEQLVDALLAFTRGGPTR
jgi:light-regulated signal transduction histidine kinase (bacteriophytochrome)